MLRLYYTKQAQLGVLALITSHLLVILEFQYMQQEFKIYIHTHFK